MTFPTQVLRRFPWVMAASLVGTWAGIASIHASAGQPVLGLSHTQAANLLMTSYLGISLLFSLALIGERFRGAWDRHLLQAAGTLFLLNYFLGIGDSRSGTTLRFGMYFLAVHLLVSFAPFLRDSRTRAFWQYNQALFVRIITSLIFSGSLYLGLWLALEALKKLLGMDIPQEARGDLWYLIAGVFNTWFFLAGVPGDFDALERRDSYPLSLKILSQNVFIPLVSLYIIILYAYAIKTLAVAGRRGEWPASWIAIPILAAGLWGILTLLLLHPVREEKDVPWVPAFTRWFYPAQWPLLVFLVMVLWQDLFRQGLKVDTYLYLVLAFWIAGIAAYSMLGKGKGIKAIPVSLFLLCLLCSFGPWGVFSLPGVGQRAHQVRHLERLMAANGLFRAGRFVPANPGHSLSQEDRIQIHDILLYLEAHGGLEILRDRVPRGASSDEILRDTGRLSQFLGLDLDEKVVMYLAPPGTCRHSYSFRRPERNGILGVRGYSSFWKNLELSGCGSTSDSLAPNYFRGPRKNDRITFRCTDNTAVITVAGRPFSLSLENTLIRMEESLPGIDSCDGRYASHPFPDGGTLTVRGENGPMKVALEVERISWEKDSSHRRFLNMEFDLLFGSK